MWIILSLGAMGLVGAMLLLILRPSTPAWTQAR